LDFSKCRPETSVTLKIYAHKEYNYGGLSAADKLKIYNGTFDSTNFTINGEGVSKDFTVAFGATQAILFSLKSTD